MTKTQISVAQAAQLWKRKGVSVSVTAIYIAIKSGKMPSSCYEISQIGVRKVHAINKAEFLDWLKSRSKIKE